MYSDFCVVNTYEMHVYSFTTPEEAEEVIARAKKRYEEDAKKFEELGRTNEYFLGAAEKSRKATFEAMTFDEFLVRQKKYLLDKPMYEITEERFYEMLDVLPPLCWTQHKNVEIFCISEFYTGSFTDQYAHDKNTGKFWCKLVDYTNKLTWIPELLYPTKPNKTSIVSVKVVGYVEVEVEHKHGESIETIREKANKLVESINFGELEDINWEVEEIIE